MKQFVAKSMIYLRAQPRYAVAQPSWNHLLKIACQDGGNFQFRYLFCMFYVYNLSCPILM